jgi:hypothetical protein
MGEVAQIMYTHVSKCKNDTCGNWSRNAGGGIECRGGVELKYDIFGTF